MNRNVYDFDGTIYRGDSTADFFLYCVIHYPGVLGTFPGAVLTYLGMWLKIVEKTRAKERFYRFLTKLPDPQVAIADFWASHFDRIYPWYLQQKRSDDLIISASPTFLVQPAADRLGVALLASRVDWKTGKTTGLNCHGAEKAVRLAAAYPEDRILHFYSDAFSDQPLAALAQQAFLVRRGRIVPWPIKKAKVQP